MKNVDSEQFDTETKSTQKTVVEQKTQKYNDSRVIIKRRQTEEKLNSIIKVLKNEPKS